MACKDNPDAYYKFLGNLSDTNPLDAVICPYTQAGGADLGMPLFSLGVFAGLGMAYSIYHESPAPAAILGIITAGFWAPLIPSVALRIAVFSIVIVITAGAYLQYTRSRDVL